MRLLRCARNDKHDPLAKKNQNWSSIYIFLNTVKGEIMQKKLSIRDLSLTGKKVFIRVDFNVPLDENRNITEDTRIRAAIPTIKYALDQGAAVVLASHLGRPKAKRQPEFSLAPVAKRLAELLKKDVEFLDDCIGDPVKQALKAMKPGEVILLENVRFYPGEEKNDPEFARQLAEGLDCVVNDAFGTAHRAHASNVGITKYLAPAAAGFLMEKEIQYFGQAIDNPQRPFVAILGGAKVSGKLEVINNLLQKVNKIIIGGGMMFTFLKSMGHEIGKSLVEEDLVGVAGDVLKTAKEKGIKLYLPVDCIVADKFDAAAVTQLVSVQEIPRDWMGLDIGPESVKLFSEALKDAKTIIWNGPMGVFEMEAFRKGTVELAQIVANSRAVSIIGGGDTVSAIQIAGVSEKVSFISTGGGASLELLEGKELPGITALTNKSA
jgi:phosphoglycerate kinase